MIQLDHLIKKFGDLTAVNDVSLKIGRGEFFAMLGPNAAGKTTTIKLLTGLNCPACGGLRMTHDLLHGDLAAAVVDNVFLLIGLPALALWVLLRVKQGQRAFTLPAIVVIAVAAIAWTVIRNMPGFPLVPTLLGQ